MSVFPSDLLEKIALYNIHTFHALLNNVPQLIKRKGLHTRAVDHFTVHTIYKGGTQEWYLNGVLHRENDLPAVISKSGTQTWYLEGVPHRDNDLPVYICVSGIQFWYRNGIFQLN